MASGENTGHCWLSWMVMRSLCRSGESDGRLGESNDRFGKSDGTSGESDGRFGETDVHQVKVMVVR